MTCDPVSSEAARVRHRAISTKNRVTWSPPGGVELVQALGKDVLKDVADARAARQLADRHVLAAPVQHLAVPRRVAVQQLQQQRTPAAPGRRLCPAGLTSNNISCFCCRQAESFGSCTLFNERESIRQTFATTPFGARQLGSTTLEDTGIIRSGEWRKRDRRRGACAFSVRRNLWCWS